MLRIVLDPRNKYNDRLYWGDRLVASGEAGNGLESVQLVTRGKRTFAVLELAPEGCEVIILQASECPERWRYEDVRSRFGDRERTAALRPLCDLLLQSPTACEGCRKQPGRGQDRARSRDVQQGPAVGATGGNNGRENPYPHPRF